MYMYVYTIFQVILVTDILVQITPQQQSKTHHRNDVGTG